MIQSSVYVIDNEGKVSIGFPFLDFGKMVYRNSKRLDRYKQVDNYTRGAHLKLRISTEFIQRLL